MVWLASCFFPVMGKGSSVSPIMTVVITGTGAWPFISALFLLTTSVVLILSLTLLTVSITFSWVFRTSNIRIVFTSSPFSNSSHFSNPQPLALELWLLYTHIWLTSWDWLTCQWSCPWRKTVPPFFNNHYLPVALHQGAGLWALPHSTLACQLVLSVFKSCLGNPIVEISWVRLPYLKGHYQSRCPVPVLRLSVFRSPLPQWFSEPYV